MSYIYVQLIDKTMFKSLYYQHLQIMSLKSATYQFIDTKELYQTEHLKFYYPHSLLTVDGRVLIIFMATTDNPQNHLLRQGLRLTG